MQTINETPGNLSGTTPRRELLQRVVNTLPLYLLVSPAVIGLLIFSYWPNFDTIRFAFYEWVPGAIADFTGLKNFRDAWNDPLFHGSLSLVALLLAANLVKMIPSIAGAILLHRLRSDRARYIFQVCFVVPMIIPGLVWLLLWKGFMDPNVGLINVFLNRTGLMQSLVWMDHNFYRLADLFYPLTWTLDRLLTESAMPFQPTLIDQTFARTANLGVWALLASGFILMLCTGKPRQWVEKWMLIIPVFLTGILLMQLKALVVIPLILLIAYGIHRKFNDPRVSDSYISRTGWIIVAIASTLILITRTWNAQIGAFDNGQPAWLGHSELIIPAVIFWGFPWIHAVGILIYLAGLQQISPDVYEAAELDGLSSLGKVFKIELPLILTQVRINLIFMTITTLNSYGFFLILLGPSGGPGGKGLVPGLYMYQQAFVANRYGYACALGLVVFVVILSLTIVYQRHVKVDK